MKINQGIQWVRKRDGQDLDLDTELARIDTSIETTEQNLNTKITNLKTSLEAESIVSDASLGGSSQAINFGWTAKHILENDTVARDFEIKTGTGLELTRSGSQFTLSNTILVPDKISAFVNDVGYWNDTIGNPKVDAKVTAHNNSVDAHQEIQDRLDLRIDTINSLITPDTSEANHLINLAQLNDAIVLLLGAPIKADAPMQNNFATLGALTSGPYFKGGANTPLVDLDLRDYAIVEKDSSHDNQMCRYIVMLVDGVKTWVFDEDIPLPAFTTEQWAAINSLANTTNIAQIQTNKNDIAQEITNRIAGDANLQNQLNGLQFIKEYKVQVAFNGNNNKTAALIPLENYNAFYLVVEQDEEFSFEDARVKQNIDFSGNTVNLQYTEVTNKVVYASVLVFKGQISAPNVGVALYNADKYLDILPYDSTRSYKHNELFVYRDKYIGWATISHDPEILVGLPTDPNPIQNGWSHNTLLARYDEVGDITKLLTTNKKSLVDAINELVTSLQDSVESADGSINITHPTASTVDLSVAADHVIYQDPRLSATNIKAAIDELADEKVNKTVGEVVQEVVLDSISVGGEVKLRVDKYDLTTDLTSTDYITFQSGSQADLAQTNSTMVDFVKNKKSNSYCLR